MEVVNYNEKVVLPYLEKKCKDLLSMNMVLEAKLLVEQNRNKDLEKLSENENEKVEGHINQIENLKLQIDNLNRTISEVQNLKNNIESERNNLQNQINEVQSKVQREESLKNNAISEYHALNSVCSQLKIENELLKTQLEDLRKKASESKPKKVKSEMVI